MVRMDKDRTANQVMNWISEWKRRRERSRKSWSETSKDDLMCLGCNGTGPDDPGDGHR